MSYIKLTYEQLEKIVNVIKDKIKAHSHDVVSTSAAGFAPKRGGTTTKFLRDDGTWAVPPDTKTTVDNSLNASSTNPVQNKIIKAELDKKAPNTLATTTKNGLMSADDKTKANLITLFPDGGFNVTYGDTSNTRFLSFPMNDDVRITPHHDHDIVIDFGDENFIFSSIGLYMAGDLHVSGNIQSDNADYAKYYEWLDGNPNNEDRRGLFVTLDGEKIKTANNTDDFILGVVSAAPGFVENSHEREWQGKYLKDVYGERITQQDDSGSEEYVINPKYNADEKYIPRSERPEWTYVGLTGELVVRDDGTCEVNGYCRASQGGIATKADTGYRVIARLDDTHIKVLIK